TELSNIAKVLQIDFESCKIRQVGPRLDAPDRPSLPHPSDAPMAEVVEIARRERSRALQSEVDANPGSPRRLEGSDPARFAKEDDRRRSAVLQPADTRR